MKVKLEVEINTYCLEDEEDFGLKDSLDSPNSMQTITKTPPGQSMDEKGFVKPMAPKL